jgi:general secretion pathway protein G
MNAFQRMNHQTPTANRVLATHHLAIKVSMAQRTSRQRNTRAGFTLLELLLVLAILVVIAGIVTTNISGASTSAKVDATKAQLSGLKSHISMYQIRMNGLPETLEELRDGPSDAAKQAKWVAPIITEIPMDAWENALDYSVNGNTYTIRSGGIDGQMNTDDDLIEEGQ